MNTRTRTCDIVTGLPDLETIGSYKLPLFQGYLDTSEVTNDQWEELIFDIGTKTGIVQIRNLVDLSIVYKESHNPGTVGRIWQNHHKQFGNFVAEFNPQNVVEIGGGHGLLSKQYLQDHPQTNWTIIDPAVTSPGNSVRVVNEFFDENTQLDISVDTIVHSHFIEHMYDPANVFKSFGILRTGTLMIFSVPYLEKHLDLKYNNTLNFEHVYLCSEEFIEYWLSLNNYQLLKKKIFGNDHSIFYAAIKVDNITHKLPLPNSYEKNRKRMLHYFDYHKNKIQHLNNTINKLNDPVYVFGGNVSSQFLIGMGLNVQNVCCLLDNDKTKHNRRLYGTDLLIQSPHVLKNADSPVVVLVNNPYCDEIKDDILTNINHNTKFIE